MPVTPQLPPAAQAHSDRRGLASNTHPLWGRCCGALLQHGHQTLIAGGYDEGPPVHWPAALGIRPELRRVVAVLARSREGVVLLSSTGVNSAGNVLSSSSGHKARRHWVSNHEPIQTARSLATACKPVEVPCLAPGRSPRRCKARRAARSRCQCPFLHTVHFPEQVRRRQWSLVSSTAWPPKHPASSSFTSASPGPISMTPLSASANRAPRATNLYSKTSLLCRAAPPYPEIFRGEISRRGSASRAD